MRRHLSVSFDLILYYGACLIISTVTGRYIHVKFSPAISKVEGFHMEVVDRPVDCVYKCASVSRCRSLFFHKNNRLCVMCSSVLHLEKEPETDSIYGTMTFSDDHYISHRALETLPSPESASPPTIQNATSSFVQILSGPSTIPVFTQSNFTLMPLEKPVTYRKAAAICNSYGGHLIKIDTEWKQIAAVKLAKASDLEVIAIGVYVRNFHWCYSDMTPVTYSAWAPGEPLRVSFFAGVSKKRNYLWVGLVSAVNGFLCEK